MIQSQRSGLWLPREYVIGEDPSRTMWERMVFAADWGARDAFTVEPPYGITEKPRWEMAYTSSEPGLWDHAALEPGTLEPVQPPQCRLPQKLGGPKMRQRYGRDR